MKYISYEYAKSSVLSKQQNYSNFSDEKDIPCIYPEVKAGVALILSVFVSSTVDTGALF